MAILKNGPNGGFSGKVGSVIGYKWKGIDVIRGLPRKSHKPRSGAQLANQQAMKLIMDSLTPLKFLIRTSFRSAAESLNMSAFNLALSMNKKQALKGEYPNLEIDWDAFQISQGKLPGAENVTATWVDTGLQLTWRDNSGEEYAYPADLLSILVYDHGNKRRNWSDFLNESSRGAGECLIQLDEERLSSAVEVFFVFMSFGGTLVSNSTHIHLPAAD